eukprot:2927773-Prymnesium_polylepis.2
MYRRGGRGAACAPRLRARRRDAGRRVAAPRRVGCRARRQAKATDETVDRHTKEKEKLQGWQTPTRGESIVTDSHLNSHCFVAVSRYFAGYFTRFAGFADGLSQDSRVSRVVSRVVCPQRYD